MRIGLSGWLDRLLPPRLAEWRDLIAAVRQQYRDEQGAELRLFAPRRFTEKMQWRKLFELDPNFAIFSDKYATRAFVAERLGPAFLPKLLALGADPAAIPFDRLEPPYVMKSTHGCGHTLMVEADGAPDRDLFREHANFWLGHSHAETKYEPGYIHVPRRLIIEEMVRRPDGTPPRERKIFVFGGKVEVIQTIVVEAGTRERSSAYRLPDWTPADCASPKTPYHGDLPRPALLAEMIEAAERLASGFGHLRINIYDCGDRFLIGEITVYSWSGFTRFDPDEADDWLGSFWHIPAPRLRAILTILTRSHEIRPLPASADKSLSGVGARADHGLAPAGESPPTRP